MCEILHRWLVQNYGIIILLIKQNMKQNAVTNNKIKIYSSDLNTFFVTPFFSSIKFSSTEVEFLYSKMKRCAQLSDSTTFPPCPSLPLPLSPFLPVSLSPSLSPSPPHILLEKPVLKMLRKAGSEFLCYISNFLVVSPICLY